MSLEILAVEELGAGITFQDLGRRDWRRFGVPPGGVMDDHAAQWANRLLGNPPDAAVIEVLLHGAVLRALRDVTIAVTGSRAEPIGVGRAFRLRQGETLSFSSLRFGVWSYVAVPGGFEATSVLGSASYYGRARLGEAITRGKVLRQRSEGVAVFPDGVAGRFMPSDVCRNYAQPPRLRIWRGPEWEAVDPRLVENVTRGEWRVSARSDRVGYRLEGVREGLPVPSIVSGPAQVGTLQCPEDGTLIVTMRDGPTVGGYARLGLLFPEDLSWLTQCRPGQSAQFEWMNYGSEL